MMKRVILLAVLGFAVCTPASAQPSWEAILRAQLMKERSCQMVKLSNVRSYELAGRHVIEVRVQCADGREYDALRRDTHRRFEFEPCPRQYCLIGRDPGMHSMFDLRQGGPTGPQPQGQT
jgi:hypothetical protein